MVHVPTTLIGHVIFASEKRFDYAKEKDDFCQPH